MAGCAQHSPRQAGCPDCRRYACRYHTRRAMAIAAGTWRYPRPAAELAQHLARCRAAPMTIREISRTCGLREGTLRDIMAGRVSTVHGPNAAAILAVQPVPVPPAGYVFAVGPRRQLQALATIGYPVRRIAAELPAQACDVQCIQSGRRRLVTLGMASRVDALYQRARIAYQGPDTLRGGNRKARTFALRRGWAGPDMWDDDTISDPTARPAAAPTPGRGDYLQSVVDDGLAGRARFADMTTAERIAVVSGLAARGWSDRRIGQWLDWAPSNSDGEHEHSPATRFRQNHQIRTGHRLARLSADREVRQIVHACT